MIRAHIATLVYTKEVTAAVKADQFVGFDGAPAGADGLVEGIAKTDGEAGDPVSLIALGLLELSAPAPIAVGDLVYSDADGKPTSTGANNPVGVCNRAAVNPGDTVTILTR